MNKPPAGGTLKALRRDPPQRSSRVWRKHGWGEGGGFGNSLEKTLDTVILEAKGIDKTFPGVHALDNVDFTLKKGEVRALMGKNGAGKSTLIKAITGVYPFDKGELFLDGKKIENVTPYNMHYYGIGAIYQENDLIPYFTIGQSMFLNNEYLKGGVFLDSKKNASGSCRYSTPFSRRRPRSL